MTSLFAPTSIYVTSVNDICKMKISLITTKILNICHHVVPRILLIMQHRKVKAWPLKFTGFWVKASLFLRLRRKIQRCFWWKMWSRRFTSKKHTVCTFSCWDREPAFVICQKKFKLFFCQRLKQFCQMCRCFVWCLKNIGFSDSALWCKGKRKVEEVFPMVHCRSHAFELDKIVDKLTTIWCCSHYIS